MEQERDIELRANSVISPSLLQAAAAVRGEDMSSHAPV